MQHVSTLALLVLAPIGTYTTAGPVYLPPPPPMVPHNDPPPAQPAPSGGSGATTGGGVRGGSTGATSGGAPASPKTPAGPSGGPRSAGPATGKPYATPAGVPTGMVTTPGVDLTTWEYWWLYNRDAYLDLKVHIEASQPQSGLNAATASADAWDQVGERVMPELLATLEDDDDREPTLAAMIAIARLCDGSARKNARELAAACVRHENDPSRAVGESAVMALGVLGSEGSVSTLCALLRDTPDGRKAFGNQAVPERTRAFAGLALGLLGTRTKVEDVRRYAVHHLVQQLTDDPAATPDTQTACAVSLGLIPLMDLAHGDAPASKSADLSPSASLAGEIAFITKLLANAEEPTYVRAHLPRALANLAAGTSHRERAARALLEFVSDGSEKAEVVQGAVLALGALGDASANKLDTEIRNALVKASDSGDLQARCFALIALAQISTRGEDGAGVEQVRTLLSDTLSKARSTRERTWSALALGVLEHGRRHGTTPAKTSATLLTTALRAARSPEEVGALAIGCGLAGADVARPALIDHLSDMKESRAQGYLALALGMLGATEAIEPLHHMLDESRTCAERLPQTALALALLEDPLLVSRLLALFDKGTSQSTLQAAAVALGVAGDRRVVDPLLGLLHDPTSIGTTRAAAISAIGRVCDRDRLPWQQAVSQNLNYRAMTVTLSDENRSGLLDQK